MTDRVPAWATTPLTRDRLYVELLPSAAPATERWNVDSKAAYLIGRSADAVDIPCPHKSASRVHACLAHRDEALYLLDLGSVHGTFLNGERLEEGAEAEIRPCDTFRIAAFSDAYRLVSRGGGSATASVPPVGPALMAAPAPSRHDPRAHRAQHPDEAAAASSRQDAALQVWDEDGQRQQLRQGERQVNGRSEADPAQRRHDAHRPRHAAEEGGRADPLHSRHEGHAQRNGEDEGRHAGPSHGRHDRHGQWNGAGERTHSDARHRQRRDSNSRVPVREGEPLHRHQDAGQSRSDGRHSRDGGWHHGSRDAGPGRGPRDRPSDHGRSRSPDRKRRREHDADERRDNRRRRDEREVARPAPERHPPVSAAVKAAARQQAAAELVRQMGGVAGGVPVHTLEQKKKLLWGAKKAESVVLASEQGLASGVNRWDAAEFTKDGDRAKFQQLMGVKQVPTAARRPEDQPAGPQQPQPEIFARDTQQRVLGELESQFLAGVRRGNKPTLGLGIL